MSTTTSFGRSCERGTFYTRVRAKYAGDLLVFKDGGNSNYIGYEIKIKEITH